MINIQNVSYSYKSQKTEVLQDFNLHIQKGEFISILGKSGCGKTTLANIICGYLTPTTGKIEIDGKVNLRPGKNKIMVNQENDLFDWMNVQQNMEIATMDSKLSREFLKMVSLEDRVNDYPNTLSGGMKKRLSLARALSAKPDLLILDEPFSYLDYATKIDLLGQFQKIVKATRTTTILVTHNIDESLYLSDRIIVLKGRPIQIVSDIKINRKKLTKEDKFDLIEEIKKSY